MKPLIIVFFIAAIGLLAAVTSRLQSHSGLTIGRAGTTGTSTLRDMQSARVAKLPAEDFDDRSLVFPRESKH